MGALIKFDSVWKKFQRGERHDSLRDLIPATAKRLFGKDTPADLERNEFWALRNVSFEVGPGESLGIIGTNGAGKSTALKLLTRILRPTLGTSTVRGRAGALIEVAAGFHPDLTGRENIYLQGTIMGMKQGEITAKLDEIIDFAGVSDFIDTPVKRYSSGMHARLGFAIASHMDPEVLIIDEVLAVGDVAFQQRCEERMLRFIRDGVALAFVSHNLQAVSRLCSKAILLERGEVKASGPTEEVVRAYVGATAHESSASDGAIVITGKELIGGRVSGHSVTVRPGDDVSLRLNISAKTAISQLTFAFIVRRATDQLVVFHSSTRCEEFGLPSLRAGEETTVEFTFQSNLVAAQYLLECRIIHIPTRRVECEVFPAGFITVEDDRAYSGIAHLNAVVRLVSASKPAPARPIAIGR